MQYFLTVCTLLLAAVLATACSQTPSSAPPRPASVGNPPVPETVPPPTVNPVEDKAPVAAAMTAEPAPGSEGTAQAPGDQGELTARSEEPVPGKEMAPPSPPQPPLPVVETPKTVIYNASMGKVTFNHVSHAGRLKCSQCHPTAVPERILLDKEVAHTLCKGCHKAGDGSAPTACTGCHKK